MGKRKRIWKSEEERLAWEAHVDETLRNLKELAEGRAEREWREQRAREQAQAS